MKGNARVYKQGKGTLVIGIPYAIKQTLKIRAGNRVEFEIENPRPDTVEQQSSGRRFMKIERGKTNAETIALHRADFEVG